MNKPSSAAPRPLFRYRLIHLLYATAVIAAGFAVSGVAGLGAWGIVAGAAVLTLWLLVACALNPRLRGYELALSIAIILLPVVAVMFTPNLPHQRTLEHPGSCTANLKRIALALRQYAVTHGEYPQAYTVDKHGRPEHSWRAQLLPFMRDEVRWSYDFNEPWDGPNNLANAHAASGLFECPQHPGGCCYHAVVGSTTFWPGQESRDLKTDRRVVAIVERPTQRNWAEPKDFSLEEFLADAAIAGDRPTKHFVRPTLFSNWGCGRWVVGADERVQFLQRNPTTEEWRQLLQIDDDRLTPDDFRQPSPGAFRIRWNVVSPLAVFLALAAAPLAIILRYPSVSSSLQPSDTRRV